MLSQVRAQTLCVLETAEKTGEPDLVYPRSPGWSYSMLVA